MLTRDEIQALDGDALDAAVAEHVMGWETYGHNLCWPRGRRGRMARKRSERGAGRSDRS